MVNQINDCPKMVRIQISPHIPDDTMEVMLPL